MRALSSIVGLPPLFLGRFPDALVLTSDLRLLSESSRRLTMDPAGVRDVFQTGYPTSHRTLYSEVSVVPGGHTVETGVHGECSVFRSWSLPETEPRLDWPSYLKTQRDAFRAAVRRLDLSTSFLALTGGLDTRAILAALVSERRRLPAATLTGPTASLDSRLAATLCKSYSLPHHVVRLDTDSLRDLPAYVVNASRLSGGLASVEKAGEIFFYRQLCGIAHRELSGELGNQVARQGLEGVSARNADVSILAADLLAAARPDPLSRPAVQNAQTWHVAYQRLIQEEASLPQVGNVCIGQHYAIQQRPYADQALIESLGRSPLGQQPVASFSPFRARWRDLRHRFLGEPRERSFQRQLISAVGGAVASCPINWGWRASGGVSAAGVAWGVISFLDAAASSHRPSARVLDRVLRLTRTRGIHETKVYGNWLRGWLRDFVHDTLLAQQTGQCGLFDATQVARVLHEHYVLGRDREATIIAALDVALAQRHFCTAA